MRMPQYALIIYNCLNNREITTKINFNKTFYTLSLSISYTARDLESDSEPYEEREPSRTVVKFSEEVSQEKDTPFVRQNTPHPKDLKAKAQKLKVERSRHEEHTTLPLMSLPEEVNHHLMMSQRSSDDRVVQQGRGSRLCVYFQCP